jgi:hypothetical protein
MVPLRVLSRTNPLRSIAANSFRFRSYKNTGGRGTPTLSLLPRAHLAKGCKNSETATLTTFRINTCKSVSKQTTLTSFRINTYKKPGEGGPLQTAGLDSASFPACDSGNARHMRHVTPLSPVPSVDCAYFLSPRACPLWWGCTPSAFSSVQSPASSIQTQTPGSVGGYALPILPVRSVFSVPARRPAGGPLWQIPFFQASSIHPQSPASRIFSATSVRRSYCSQAIHSANIIKVQTRGAAGVAGSRADKAWQL